MQDADEIIANTPYEEKPYWHIERARVKGTRNVPIEIIVNGAHPVMRTITANQIFQDRLNARVLRISCNQDRDCC